MPYDDKDIGIIFPTRKGEPIGSDNERTMIDNIEGADQIRTSIRISEDENGCKKTVRLRTRWGYPDFVTEKVCSDEEENVPIYMDTGAVEIISVNPNDPRSLDPAPLWYSTIQRTYYATKKLLGKIFPPKVDVTTPPVEGEPGLSFKDYRGDLVSKKACSMYCPPSMFTGKARLYVQALYGRDVKDWKWELYIPDGLSPRLLHENGATLNINTGVYTDDKHNHWLVTIFPDGILVTKLVRGKKVEPLVDKWKDPAFSADHKKIEAYILAYSVPSTTMTFILDVSVPETQMLGYGWKFNWSGNKADIIKHIEGTPEHTSMHYRFTFFRDSALVGPNNTPEQEAVRWTATLSTVSGPHYWHNSQFAQVIAYPDWLSSGMWIFGTKYGTTKGTGVPVYCFYNAVDVLEVFTYNASVGDARAMASRTSYPTTWGITCDWTADTWIGMNATSYDTFSTFFTDGGGSEWRQRSSDPSSIGFTCSAGTTEAVTNYYNYQVRTTSGKIINNSGVTWGGFGWEQSHGTAQQVDLRTFSYGSSTITLSDGVTATVGAGAYVENLATWGPGLYQSAFGCYHQIVGLAYDEGVNSEVVQTLLAIPFSDAEAAYLTGEHIKTRTSSGWTGDGAGRMDNIWGSPLRLSVSGSIEEEATIGKFHEDSWGLATVGFSEYSDRVTTTTTSLLSQLVTKSGNYDFSPPISLSAFYSGQPIVQQQFRTTSAAVGAAAFGFGTKNLDGFPDTFQESPPFIGWA